MEFDGLTYAIESLTREMVYQRECFTREMKWHREQMQAQSDEVDKWQVTMLANAKDQLSALERIGHETTMIAQSLQDCESHPKELVDRLAPPLYDD